MKEYRKLGQEYAPIDDPRYEKACPECKGEGEVDGKTCDLCDGAGAISSSRYRSWQREQRSWAKAREMGVD